MSVMLILLIVVFFGGFMLLAVSRQGAVSRTPVQTGGSISFAFKGETHLHQITDVQVVQNADGVPLGAVVEFDGELRLSGQAPAGDEAPLTSNSLTFELDMPGSNVAVEEGKLFIRRSASKLGAAYLTFAAYASGTSITAQKSVKVTYSAPIEKAS